MVRLAQNELLEAVDRARRLRLAVPDGRPTSGLREQWARRTGVREPVIVARAGPCGCAVDGHTAARQAGAFR